MRYQLCCVSVAGSLNEQLQRSICGIIGPVPDEKVVNDQSCTFNRFMNFGAGIAAEFELHLMVEQFKDALPGLGSRPLP